jgi:hypothetical protein
LLEIQAPIHGQDIGVGERHPLPPGPTRGDRDVIADAETRRRTGLDDDARAFDADR